MTDWRAGGFVGRNGKFSFIKCEAEKLGGGLVDTILTRDSLF